MQKEQGQNIQDKEYVVDLRSKKQIKKQNQDNRPKITKDYSQDGKGKKIGVLGDLRIILEHPQFRPLRSVFALWVVFTLVIGGYWAYTLYDVEFSSAATSVDDTQSEFDTGSYSYTQWDGTNSWVEGTNSTPNPIWELPDNATTTSWQNMNGNVGLWHMNESSGTIVDSSGQSNDGTSEGVTYGVAGKLNTAISFDGTNDYINVGDIEMNGWTTLTVSAWIKDSGVTNNRIVSKDQQGVQGAWMLWVDGNGDLAFQVHDGTSFRNAIYTEYTQNDNWRQVVGVLNSSTVSLYLDGVLVASSNTMTAGIDDTDNEIITIGADSDPVTKAFAWNGSIDEVSIWNRSLSDTEITNIYKQQSILYSGTYTSNIKDVSGDSIWNSIAWTPERPVGKELPDNAQSETAYTSGNANMTGNVGLWHMNESSGTIVDSSGQGNNGTYNGALYSQAGKLNTAIGLDGSNDYIALSTDFFAADQAAGTFALWFKPSSKSSTFRLIDMETITYIEYNPTSAQLQASLYQKENPDGYKTVDSNTDIVLDQWQHVAITHDGTNLKIFVNGVEKNSIAAKTAYYTLPSVVSAIGAIYNGSSRNFNGSIDEVAIYSRALSATEIADMYKRGALKLKYQVRSCNDAACSGDSFIGPDGTSTDYYQWATSTATTTPSFNLTNVSNNRYFQYKAFFETDDASFAPELKSVTVDYTLLNAPPDTPTNSAPGSGATGQVLLPTLTASTYSDGDSNPQTDAQWQVDDNSDFSSPEWTRTAGSAETSTVVNSTNGTFANSLSGQTELTHNTTYYFRVRYNDGTVWSEYSSGTSFTTNVNNTPTNSSPSDTATGQSLNATLSASVFNDDQTGHTHGDTTWQVDDNSDFSSPEWTRTAGAGETSTDVNASNGTFANDLSGKTELAHNTTYYFRVRYQDSGSQWSEYSTSTSFTTNLLDTPTNSTPLDNATMLTFTPLLTSSAFSDNDGGHTHAASQWQVDDNPDFSSPAYDSGETSSGEVSHAVPQGNLSNFTTYHWRVRYKDSAGEWSNWSSSTQFSVNISTTAVNVEPVFGNTTVDQGDSVQIDAQVSNFTDGSPLNSSTVTIDIYNPSGSKIVTGATMSYLTGSNGIYRYAYTVPSTSGSYLYEVKAIDGVNTGYAAANFEVRTIAADVSSTQSTVSTIDTNVDSVLTDTSTTILNQINTATSTIVSEVNANEVKIDTIDSNVDSLVSNMDILIGAMIVTQSTVSDASPGATSFDTALTNSTDDFYKNAVLTFTSGALDGQSRRISGYDGTTKVITLEPALTSAPANGDAFTIVAQNVRVEEQVASVATTVSDTNTKVTDIQNTVNSINTLLSSVDSKIDTLQSAVSSVRTSQQALYNVELSGPDSVQAGNTYRVKLTIEDYESDPVAASSTPTIMIYDSARAVALATTTMTEISTGVYEATYAVPSGATTGLYESVVSVEVGGGTLTRVDYWQVTGAPSQVIINFMSDLSVPTIAADVTIQNEGNASYEYQYEWCVVDSQENQCGGNDDVYYGSAAKLVTPGIDFNPTLTATVPEAGDYWFKVVNYFGTESSSASRSFSAVTESASSSGGSGSDSGGNGPIIGSNVATLNQLQLTSDQLINALEDAATININVVGLESLLRVSERNTETLKDVQNKLAELRAVSDTINAVVTNNSTAPIVQAFMQFNSVELRFLITNPSKEKQTLKFKAPLPSEATPEDIMSADGLTVEYDPNAESYFVSAEIELEGGESVVKRVEMRDIWVFEPEEIKALREQAEAYADVLETTQYGAQATLLLGEINRLLTTIGQTQATSYDTPQNHIVVYRTNVERMKQVDTALLKLKDIVAQAGASRGLLGSIGGIQTFATWGIVLALVFGFGLLAAIIFAMWRQQTMLITALGKHGKRIPGLKYPNLQIPQSPSGVQDNKVDYAVYKQGFNLPEHHDPDTLLGRFVHIVRVLSGSVLGILILISFPGFILGVLMFSVPSVVAKHGIEQNNNLTVATSSESNISASANDATLVNFETFTKSSASSPNINESVDLGVISKLLIKETPTGWLNVRGKPSISEKLLGKVYPGDEYIFESEKDGWYYIVIPKGIDGWVSGDYVEILDP